MENNIVIPQQIKKKNFCMIQGTSQYIPYRSESQDSNKIYTPMCREALFTIVKGKITPSIHQLMNELNNTYIQWNII